MTSKLYFPVILSLFFLLPRTAKSATVELKNDDAMAIYVSIGKDDGVTMDDNYSVSASNGKVITNIYPFELFEDGFWSQPLEREVFDRLETGMTVEPVDLSEKDSASIRTKGRAWFQRRIRERLDALSEELETVEIKAKDLEKKYSDLDDDFTKIKDKLGAKLPRRVEEKFEEFIDNLNALEELRLKRNDLETQRSYLFEEEEVSLSEFDLLTKKINKFDEKIDKRREALTNAHTELQRLLERYKMPASKWEKPFETFDGLREELKTLKKEIRRLAKELQEQAKAAR